MTTRIIVFTSFLWLGIAACVLLSVQGFAPTWGTSRTGGGLVATTTASSSFSPSLASTTLLQAAKKRRRRRKAATEDPVKHAPKVADEYRTAADEDQDDDDDDDDDAVEVLSEKQQSKVDESVGFDFQPPRADPAILPGSDPTLTSSSSSSSSSSTTDGPIPLPDIRDQLKRKELQEKIAQMEAEEAANKVKIKRSDREAFIKLLESQPFADADDSFFEEEAYNTVSALLGERAKPFLGIPTGPLQVGHFIGALGILLMAFVEYPGFPLTNLPTPIRDALAGALAMVYAINAVLAVVAVFKAQERGQPVPLWVVKTFTVGGLAYDQLTQLPTTAEVERVQSIKGARALKNRKR